MFFFDILRIALIGFIEWHLQHTVCTCKLWKIRYLLLSFMLCIVTENSVESPIVFLSLESLMNDEIVLIKFRKS